MFGDVLEVTLQDVRRLAVGGRVDDLREIDQSRALVADQNVES